VAEIHARIVQVRARGGAVLLVSEDLDELLEVQPQRQSAHGSGARSGIPERQCKTCAMKRR